MDGDKSIYELNPEEYLKGRIEYLKNKVKEYRIEIKRMEDLLATSEINSFKFIEANNKQLRIENPELDFSVTYWKPLVYDFLFDNTSKNTTEQILVGADVTKKYQKTKAERNKAIKTISSSLFLLHKEGKILKHENKGRRGFKWSIKEKDWQQGIVDAISEIQKINP